MAKYTATLLGQDTTTKLPPNYIPGFISDGNQATNVVSESLSKAITNEKKQKYEREQALMDGVISGHFSPEITLDVMKDIEGLTGYNSNSKEYATALNKATAKLKVATQKQANVTATLKRGKDNFDADEDGKYYKEENFFKFQEDSTNIELTNKAYANGYKNFLGNVDNVNQDLVREDFVDKIGKLTYGGSSYEEGDDIAGLKTMTQSIYNSEKTMFYKLDGNKTVPVFSSSSDVPQELVDKWYTSGKANMAMMDSYVNKKLKGQTFTDTASHNKAEAEARKEFINEQMKQVIPDYKAVSKKNSQFLDGQGGGSGGSGNANPLISQMAEVIQGSTNIIDENTPLDRISLGDSDEEINVYNVSSKVDKFFFGKDEDGDPIKADNVYLSTSKTDGENTLYVEIGKEVKSFRESQFKQLMNDMSQGKMNGFDITDLQKSNLYNQNTQQYDLNRASGEGAAFVEEVSDAEILNRRKVQSLNGLNKALSGFGLGSDSVSPLDELSISDFKSNAQSRKLSESLTSALVGKRIPTFNGGSEIVTIASDQGYVYQTNKNINIEYADGQSESISLNDFKERFK